MASLQGLPTELLVEILVSCPTTQTLLHLSSINRHMRAIWLEHPKHIIVANHKPSIPHIGQAIALTLTEVQCGEISESPEDHSISSLATPESTRDQPPPPPIRLYLPRIIHNARLATMVCDDFADTLRTGGLFERSWQPTEDPYTDSLRAYYIMRHIALAWHHVRLRPAVTSALSESSYNRLQECKHLFLSLERCPSHEIQVAHAMWERVAEAERDSDDDEFEKMTERWRAVECVLLDAVQYREIGFERVSDWDLTRYSDEEAWNLRIRRGITFASMAYAHSIDSKVPDSNL